MILFYVKNTGEIVGTVEGRVHSENILSDDFYMIPEGFTKDQIGKYVVPFTEKVGIIEEPIYKQKVDPATLEIKSVLVGKKKNKRVLELEPNVPFSGLIRDFENRKKLATHYKIIVNKQGKIDNLVERKK